jgi:Protein of unknown function (DUF2845)
MNRRIAHSLGSFWLLAGSCSVTLLAGTAAAGEQFRCGSWVVSAGMSVADLKAKCGEPTKKTVETQDVLVRAAGGGTIKTGTTTVEHWTYGPFHMVATITDGVISNLERGE